MATGQNPPTLQSLIDDLDNVTDGATAMALLQKLQEWSGETIVLNIEETNLEEDKVVLQSAVNSVCEILKRFIAVESSETSSAPMEM